MGLPCFAYCVWCVWWEAEGPPDLSFLTLYCCPGGAVYPTSQASMELLCACPAERCENDSDWRGN